MTAPGRQPPPVVPTLTEVVAGLSAAPAAAVDRQGPEAMARKASEPEPTIGALVDTVTDQVMARLLPELQWRIADALQDWMLAQSSAGAVQIAAVLRDHIADHVRQALGEALGSTRY
ncbi:MAG: hypothetical protein P3W97_000415 [Tepidimonas sp.]|uniref:hypothetical protein n=1 Tax=Tepidimonas sp. TaxID=2002775 RepID=UPI00259F04B6|nr:hypothetical protein [Tepidimonas sp.]MDM7455757.1 hypothetical protein [Tepidimonas sp.]